jgi:hypothetical protein
MIADDVQNYSKQPWWLEQTNVMAIEKICHGYWTTVVTKANRCHDHKEQIEVITAFKCHFYCVQMP